MVETKDKAGNPQIPGFVLKKGKDGGWVYGTDPKYWNAQLNERIIPVAPEYDVIRGVILKGAPYALTQSTVAANPRNMDLPTVTELSERKISQVETHAVRSPLEAAAYASNVFVFPALMVDTTYGEQLIAGQAGETEVEDSFPYAVRDGKIFISRVMEEDVEGLAYVAHVRVPVDLRKYFRKPQDMEGFRYRVNTLRNIPENGLTNQIFNDLFKERLEKISARVTEVRNKPVKGVLLGTINVNDRFADKIFTLGYDPHGEMVMAASYLV